MTFPLRQNLHQILFHSLVKPWYLVTLVLAICPAERSFISVVRQNIALLIDLSNMCILERKGRWMPHRKIRGGFNPSGIFSRARWYIVRFHGQLSMEANTCNKQSLREVPSLPLKWIFKCSEAVSKTCKLEKGRKTITLFLTTLSLSVGKCSR